MMKKLTPYFLLAPFFIIIFLMLDGLIAGIIQSFGIIPAFGLNEFTLANYLELVKNPDIINSFSYSLYIAFFSAFISTVIAIIICGIIVMNKAYKGSIAMAVKIPIIIPHFVVALFTIQLLSQNGLIARLAYMLGIIKEQADFPLLIYDKFGKGIIFAYAWKEIPFIIFFVIGIMNNINQKAGEAAVNLGASRLQSFLYVSLPLCRESILNGFLIIFVYAFGAYELPFLLGATLPKTLPIYAYQQYIHPDLRNRPKAMAINTLILLISVVISVIYYRSAKKISDRGIYK